MAASNYIGPSAKKSTCKAKDPKNCRFHGTGRFTQANVQAANDQKMKQRKAQAGLSKNTVKCEEKAISLALAHHQIAQRPLTASSSNVEANLLAREIHDMPDNEKFGVFFGKTVNEISQSMKHLYQTISGVLKTAGYTDPSKWNFERSTNNRVGSDIEETTSNLSFELKFGKPTDLNVGIGTVATIFGNDVISKFPTQEHRTKWRGLYIAGSMDQIDKEHRESLEQVKETMNSYKGTLSYSASNTMDAFYSGVTSLDEIQRIDDQNIAQGIYDDHKAGKLVKSTKRKITRLRLEESLEWKDVTPPEQNFDLWEFNNAILTEDSRLSFYFNGKNAITVKMIYNYKNNYRFTGVNGIDGKPLVAPAKKGLGSGSFNGWVYLGQNKSESNPNTH